MLSSGATRFSRNGVMIDPLMLARNPDDLMKASEAELLLLCLRHDADPARIDRLLAGPVDWTRLVEISLDHGVTALLFRTLLDRHAASVPDEIRAAALHFRAESGAQARRGIQDLAILLDRLAAAGVAAVPLKGPVLGLLLYGDLSLRPFRDIDFLIRESDIMPALAVVTALGYRPRETNLRPIEAAAQRRYAGEVILFRGPADLPIEPHWAFAPRTMAVPIDYQALWRRIRPLPLDNREVLALESEDLLLSLAVHGAKEHWARLKWLCDLAELLRQRPNLDWVQLLDRARRQGCLRMLLLGLDLAASVLGARLPPDLPSDSVSAGLATDLRARLFEPGFEPPSIFLLCRFGWRLRERTRDRMRYALRTAATPRVQHFSIIRLPAWLFFAYVPIKLAHDYLLLPLWLQLKRTRERNSAAEDQEGIGP